MVKPLVLRDAESLSGRARAAKIEAAHTMKVSEFCRCWSCGRQYSTLPETERFWCNYCSTMNSKPFMGA
jgi:protein-arginine kinase activator protein McsA